MKVCNECGYEKDSHHFNHCKGNKDKLENKCRQCKNTRTKHLNKSNGANLNREGRKFYLIEKRTGCTETMYSDMLLEQRGLCCICKIQMIEPYVDHCHDTLKIRGLLCGNCNTGIGMLKHNITVLRNAIEYLEKERPSPSIEQLFRLMGTGRRH